MSDYPTSNYPPRPPQELTYASSFPGRSSGMRQGAWIALLILGIFSICGGMCLGGITGLSAFMMHTITTMPRPAGAAPRSVPSHIIIVMWCVAAGLLVIPVTMGTVEIICSVKIRAGSKAAAIVVLVIVGLQILLCLTLLTFSVAGAFMHGGGAMRFENILMPVLFNGAIALALGAVEALLIAVLRERPVARRWPS